MLKITRDDAVKAHAGLVDATAALRRGDLVAARDGVDQFWAAVEDGYDDFDAADDVADVDRALSDVAGDDRFAGCADELDVEVGGTRNFAEWANHMEEAIDDLAVAAGISA